MRSTRASAAWAGIALATSFLSITILCPLPRTPANSTAAAVTTRDSSLDALKTANVATNDKLGIDADRGSH